MLCGEFDSCKAVRSVMFDFIPIPVNIGKFSGPGRDTYFYVSGFDSNVTTASAPGEFARRFFLRQRDGVERLAV